MQINNNAVYYPLVPTGQHNKTNRLPVVIDAQGEQSFQKSVNQYQTTNAVENSHNHNYQQAQFVRASARIASSDNNLASTALPKPVQHYLQIAALPTSSQSMTSSGLIDEKV